MSLALLLGALLTWRQCGFDNGAPKMVTCAACGTDNKEVRLSDLGVLAPSLTGPAGNQVLQELWRAARRGGRGLARAQERALDQAQKGGLCQLRQAQRPRLRRMRLRRARAGPRQGQDAREDGAEKGHAQRQKGRR